MMQVCRKDVRRRSLPHVCDSAARLDRYVGCKVQEVYMTADMLKWPLGACMTQVAHAATAALWRYKDAEGTVAYMQDVEYMRKVTLQVRRRVPFCAMFLYSTRRLLMRQH